jgi:hypothetical protein
MINDGVVLASAMRSLLWLALAVSSDDIHSALQNEHGLLDREPLGLLWVACFCNLKGIALVTLSDSYEEKSRLVQRNRFLESNRSL